MAKNAANAALLTLVLAAAARAADAPQVLVWGPPRPEWNLFVQESERPFLKDEAESPTALALSPDGALAVTCHDDGQALVWEARMGRLLRRLKVGGVVTDAAFARADGSLWVRTSDWLLVHFDPRDGRRLGEIRLKPRPAEGLSLRLAVSPDGRRILLFGDEKGASLVGTAPEEVPRDIGERSSAVPDAAFSPDGRAVATCSRDGAVRLWDADSGKLLWKTGRGSHLDRLAFEPDGRRLLAAGTYGPVVELDAATGAVLRVLTPDRTGKGAAVPVQVSVSADGRRAFVCGLSHSVLLDLAAPAVLYSDDYGYRQGVLSPDGRELLSRTILGRATFFDLQTREFLAEYRVTPRLATSVSPSEVLADPGTGLDLFARTARAAVGREVGAPPSPPSPLTQGPYEGTVRFQERVAEAKRRYDEEVAAHRRKAAEFPEDRRRLLTAAAFATVFRTPKVAATRYDPDAQAFTVEVAPDDERGAQGLLPSSESLAFRHVLTLKDPVPNDKAEAFDRALKTARPTLRFTLDAGRLLLDDATLTVGGTDYAAVPGGAPADRTQAVARIAPDPAAEAARVASVTLGSDPLLARKELELEKLRRQRAEKERLRALETEIARLKTGESAAEKEYASDVDAAGRSLPERPDDFAVVVGVGKYSKLPEAQFAERDAEAVRRRLLALGVPERNLIYLTGADATRSRLEAKLEGWLPKNVKPDSRVYFYYSGHGAPDPRTGEAYLVPWDGEAEYLDQTAFPLKRLYSDLGRLKARSVLVALDSCFSGAGGRSVLAKGARPLVNRLAEESPAPGVTVLAASSGSQISGTLEPQGHGLFTYELLKALADAPTKASAAYAKLKPLVQDEARRQNREQTPLLLGPDATIP